MINKMYSKIITAIALSLVLLPSYADDESLLALSKELTSGDAFIETIVVTGRRDNQIAENLIGSLGRVGPEEIERMGHAHISQAASRLAGVWLSRGNG